MGKKTEHILCLDCGKIIGSVMGGFKKHTASCKYNNEHWAKLELQRLFDKENWHGLTQFERHMYNFLKKRTAFEPVYNCPA